MKTIVVHWREASHHSATITVPDEFDLADHDALEQAVHEVAHETWQSGHSFDFHATPTDRRSNAHESH